MFSLFSTIPSFSLAESLKTLWDSTGFVTSLTPLWQNLIMMVIAGVLIYLAIAKEFEPNLLVAIGFGMFIINIPGAYQALYGTPVVYDPSAENFEQILQIAAAHGIDTTTLNVGDYLLAHGSKIVYEGTEGLFFYLYKGVEWVIYPPLIFLGIGAMTDFGPLIANPKSLIMGAAAQLGIFITFLVAINIGFTGEEAAAIGIIGGADGPTAIYVTTKLAAHLLPAIAVAAYSYMALIKVIQPPIMKLLTTKRERSIVMEQLRPVSKLEKVVFPIAVTLIVGIILPSALPLLGMLMLGNLFKESGVVPRLTNTAKNELINIVTIVLGLLVGTKATADVFLDVKTLLILLIGVVAFGFGTAGGVLIGKLMCVITKGKVNPLIGAAGVSAVPMAARIAHNVGQEENPSNYLLMHAMGPNVAGVIGSAVAAGVLLSVFGVA